MRIVSMIPAERGTYIRHKSLTGPKEVVIMWVHVEMDDERECILGASCSDMVALSNPAAIEKTAMLIISRMATCEYVTAASR